jgi:signal transduction histidine kinase
MPLPAESRQEILATEHPIVRDILASGAPVLIPDVSAHPGWSLPRERPPEASWMGIPLFARGNVAGLFALSRREADYFREEHVKLAEALSSQASVAVENAVLFEQMQASGLRMRALSRRLVEVQESERRHIALELHDEAGQALVSLRLGLRLLERQIAEGGDVAGRVAELVETTDGILDGLHRLAADLRPASLDHLGLDTALRQHTQSVAAKSGLPVHYKARGFTSERLHQQVETGLYRVVQEAMTNVVRHARATRIDVLVERREDRVLVMVEDDGAGFDPALVQSGDHLGLLGMRERADALGGTMTVESAPGKGTTIVVEVPSADPDPDR